MEYHRPVMLKECLQGLSIDPRGIYVDLTFGGGGHSRAILEHLQDGQLFAFDQDEDAKLQSVSLQDKGFHFIQANFKYVANYLQMYGVTKVDGMLADLGVSSYQIDEPTRGFSTRSDGSLDMRMDRSVNKSAIQVVNEYSEKQMTTIFREYGELKLAGRLARMVIAAREQNLIRTADQLKTVLSNAAPRGKENKFYAKVFQAIRIEVNDELSALKEVLELSSGLLNPGGRFVVMSYHSLEDRLVKNFFAKGKFSGEVDRDIYGNFLRPFKPINRRPIRPHMDEIHTNSRARSAKLRIAEKL